MEHYTIHVFIYPHSLLMLSPVWQYNIKLLQSFQSIKCTFLNFDNILVVYTRKYCFSCFRKNNQIIMHILFSMYWSKDNIYWILFYSKDIIYWTKKLRDQNYAVQSLKHKYNVNSIKSKPIFKNIHFPWFLYLRAEHVTLSSVKTRLEVRLPSKFKYCEILIGK